MRRAGKAAQAAALARRMRLGAYAANRADVVRCLLGQLATLPEAIEIGRVTGLTLGQVLPLSGFKPANPNIPHPPLLMPTAHSLGQSSERSPRL